MDDLNSFVMAGIPTQMANLQLPDPYLRDTYLDEQDRIYRLDHELTDNDLALVDMILKCNKDPIPETMKTSGELYRLI